MLAGNDLPGVTEMTASGRKRARITRMTSMRSKRRPRGAANGKVFSIRFPDELAAKIDATRGGVEFGTYVRLLVEAALVSPVESAVNDCRAYNAQRGVTPEMLLGKPSKK